MTSDTGLERLDDLVVFDGVCNFCIRSVSFILRHEAGPVLRFVPLQSPAGRHLMERFGFDPEDANTFVLIADGKSHARSDAALRVLRYLKGPWRVLAVFKVIPRPLRDRAYDLIATNRYRWFGRRESCMLPTPERRARFIQEWLEAP